MKLWTYICGGVITLLIIILYAYNGVDYIYILTSAVTDHIWTMERLDIHRHIEALLDDIINIIMHALWWIMIITFLEWRLN